MKVIGLTFDGTATNIAMANAFGCNLKVDEDGLKTSFQHPTSDHQVFVLLDACHMLKLVRNMFCSQSKFCTINGEARWQYIQQLNELQNLSDLRLAEHLSDRHVYFSNQKMKVVLAAQTLSQSVASALEFLRTRDSDFAEAEATIEFISLFNDIFDVLNSKNVIAEGFKSPCVRAISMP